MQKTVCELFAGVGGFRLGLERASKEWETVWFSQWEPGKTKQWAHDCYVKHWGDIDDKTGIDIAAVDKAGIPKHNLLVGGFPCQDYSVARPLPGSKGIAGKKGVLWWQIHNLLSVHHSPFVLLENVDRLLKSPATQRGRDFGIILACLNNLGYDVEWRVVNAADYGAAQRRRRIFIFAYKGTTHYAETMRRKNPLDVIAEDGFFPKSFPAECVCGTSFTALPDDDLHGISSHFGFPFEPAGYMCQGSILTADVRPRTERSITLGEILQHGVPDSYSVTDNLEKWEYLKGAKKVRRMSKSGHEYTFTEGAIAMPDKLDAPARTMLTSESSLNRSSHLIKDPETGQFRIITPVEAERIQGFDDNWTDTGMPEKFRYFCMGNALVVPMVTRMANELGKIFDNEN